MFSVKILERFQESVHKPVEDVPSRSEAVPESKVRSRGSSNNIPLTSSHYPRQSAGGIPGLGKACQDTIFTFEDHCLEGKLTFGNPLQGSGVDPAQDHVCAHVCSRLQEHV